MMRTVLFLAMCFVVAQGFPGSPRSPKPRRESTDRSSREANFKQRCMAKCVASNKCPVRMNASDSMQNQRQECKECVQEACGHFDRSNKSAVKDCVEQAKDNCSVCPTSSPAERAFKAKCKACMKKCKPDSPRSPKVNRRDRDSGTESRSPKQSRGQCYRSCVTAGNCTSLKIVREQMKAARNACKECVEDDCGSYMKSNRSEIAECIKDAKEECDECPPVAERDQAKKKQCKVCLRKCSSKPARRKGRGSGSRGSSGRGRGSSRRPESNLEFLVRMITCIRNRPVCESCPKTKDMRQKMKNATKACKACVKEECGDIDRSNKTEVAECVQLARGDCTFCPPISEQEQITKKNCSNCLKRCADTKGTLYLLNGSILRPYGYPRGYPRVPTQGRNRQGGSSNRQRGG